MWTYEQTTGRMIDGYGEIVGTGYSGAGEGKNNPAMQNVHNVGPCPAGEYVMKEVIDSPEHGPFAIVLVPKPGTEMYGRSGFLCHGDSLAHPGAASEGCIIQTYPTRVKMWDSPDHDLQVIANAGSVYESPLEKT